jgi:hypothetical protein
VLIEPSIGPVVDVVDVVGVPLLASGVSSPVLWGALASLVLSPLPSGQAASVAVQSPMQRARRLGPDQNLG